MKQPYEINLAIYSLINKIIDIIKLNIIWLIFSLPILTIGASTTALYYVTLNMVENKEESIFKSFLKSFKLNLKQATIMWIPYLIIGCILAIGFMVLRPDTTTIAKIFKGIILLVFVVYGLSILYTFPLLAKFDNTIKRTLFNGLYFSILHFKSTIYMVLFLAFVALVMYLIPYTPLLMLVGGTAFSAFFCSIFFIKIFNQYIPDGTETVEISEQNDAILVNDATNEDRVSYEDSDDGEHMLTTGSTDDDKDMVSLVNSDDNEDIQQ